MDYTYDVTVASDSRLEVRAIAKHAGETLARVSLGLRWFDDGIVGDRNGGSTHQIVFETWGAWDNFDEDQTRLAQLLGSRVTVYAKDRDDMNAIRDAVEEDLREARMPETLAQWRGRG